MYSSYTAASFARKLDLAEKHGVNLEGALTWAFTFEDQPYFAGFRQLASQGIDLPVLNVFRMYAQMGGERIGAESSAEVPLATMVKEGVRGAPDVSALASVDGKRLAVMVWHYHDDDVPGPEARITLRLTHLPIALGRAKVTEYRIDESHSNAYSVWKQMGSPQSPTREQIAAMVKAGRLQKLRDQAKSVEVTDHTARLETTLPRQAVSLFVLEW
jgi:xylan 1,4-beta-xylosidase